MIVVSLTIAFPFLLCAVMLPLDILINPPSTALLTPREINISAVREFPL